MEHITVPVPGGELVARVTGPLDGDRLLLLHGGPGLSDSYLDPLIAEFADAYRVATYAQRAVPPSTAGEPFDMATHSADAVAVLDELMWDRVIVLGHSWGGHLLLHIVAANAHRLTAAVSLDGIGGVGNGGIAAFDAEMARRLPQDARVRLEALKSVEADRPLAPAEQDEELELVWPSNFASPAVAPPFTAIKSSAEAIQGGFAALLEALPTLAPCLSETQVRTLLVACTEGPIPSRAAEDTASVMGPRASVLALPDLGHFPWLEQPGVVRRLVDEFMSAGVGSSPRRIRR